MGVTLRRQQRTIAADADAIRLDAVTAANGSGLVPSRGPEACLSLWGRGMPEASGLTDLAVEVNGSVLRGCYLSPIGIEGSYQLNALLQKKINTGDALVRLSYRGVAVGQKTITVISAPLRTPRLALVTDATDLTSVSRIRCQRFKAIVEDLENPAEVLFYIDGRPAEIIDSECLDAVLDRHYFTVSVPRHAEVGKHVLAVSIGSQTLPDVTIEVA